MVRLLLRRSQTIILATFLLSAFAITTATTTSFLSTLPISPVVTLPSAIAQEQQLENGTAEEEEEATAATNATYPLVRKSPTVNDPNLEIQLVYEGLKNPANMEFLGHNDILVLEKNDGTVRRIVNGVMFGEPMLDVHVANLVERGMLGIAIAKHENGPTYVFLYYTQALTADGEDAFGAAPLGNRLYRYELVDGRLENGKSLIHIPANRGGSHNGGKVLIGPDNNVYLVVGDVAAHKTRAQNYYYDSSAVGGTSVIFRITQEGESAGLILGRDEPVSKYYAYGIRNSFGMDFDPLTGKLWDTENGPTYNDEINLVEPGFNSGWAIVTGASSLLPLVASNKTTPFNPEKDLVSCLYCRDSTGILDVWINKNIFGIQDGKYREPEFTWLAPVGPTAIKFLVSDKLGKEYENDMFVGDVVPGNIYHFELNENRDGLVLNGSLSDKIAHGWHELDSVIFAQGFSGVTDVDVGPDGYLYILTYFGNPAIYRIVPKGTPLPFS